MREWWGLGMMAVLLAGCHGVSSVPLRPSEPPLLPARNELPTTSPIVPVLDGRGLASLPPNAIGSSEATVFRRLREVDCLSLSTANVTAASLLERENQLSGQSPDNKFAACGFRQAIRSYTALELQNRAGGEALERFFQLVELEARTDLLRRSFAIVKDLSIKAEAARTAVVRFPIEGADLDRQRSQFESQWEQAKLGARLLDLDLKHRLGLPATAAEERLWPVGDFTVDPTDLNPDAAVNAAMADRPLLRGLRAFEQGVTAETLPEARALLQAGSPLLGLAPGEAKPGLLSQCALVLDVRRKTATPAELQVRKQQLRAMIVDQERVVAAETRAAVLTANSQRIRATLARDRVLSWEKTLAEAEKKRAASQPGAEFLVPQVQLELLKARSELAVEIVAWHQARIKVKAAEGWLVWEALTVKAERESKK
jgi:hypothetical protein